MWPTTESGLLAEQQRLAARLQPLLDIDEVGTIGGCFVCFRRGGAGAGEVGDPGWAAAAVLRGRRMLATAVVPGTAGAPYRPGLLALREGHLLEAAVAELRVRPDLLLVNATGRDHPRRAGLALHLGALLGLATVGVTDRTLVAAGAPPGPERGDRSLLEIDGERVGFWLRTRAGARPVAVHAAWGAEPEDAAAIVLRATAGARTPEPLRRARTVARTARGRA